MADRADFLQIRIGQDRLAHFHALAARRTHQIENVRPRTDKGDQAHHQFLADRIDRRVRYLGEVLLEIGVQHLRLVRHRRNRRIGTHRTDGFLTGGRHWRHQQLGVFLGVAKGLLPVEQRNIATKGARFHRFQVFQNELGMLQPFAIGMLGRNPALDLVIGNDAAFFEIDQQHATGLQPPFLDDLLLCHRKNACFRRHDDPVIVGHDIPGGPQPVAVECCTDLPTVTEGNRRRAVPRLHQRGMVFVERLAVVAHQLVAGPGFRDQHHHRMNERIAALIQKLERVVEARRIRLAFIGDRPQLGDVIAEQFGVDRRLTGRHPVIVAAQGVDLAVVSHHAVGMRQLPGREGIGRKPLVNQRHGGFKRLILEVEIILADLIGQEHALVDNRARRHGNGIETVVAALGFPVDPVGDDLAQQKNAAFEHVLVFNGFRARDEHLQVDRFAGHDVGRR